MLSTLDGALSRHADWREDHRLIFDDGVPIDPSSSLPSSHVVRVVLCRDDPCCGGRSLADYGWRRPIGGSALDASTDDGTHRVVILSTGVGLLVSWLFPASEMRRLDPGSYRGAILVTQPSQPDRATLLESFTKVVR